MVTLPLIYALQEPSSNGYHQRVQDLLNQTTQKEEDILAVVNWVAQGNGIKKSLMDAHAHGNRAREALYHFPASPDRDVLDELIDFVLVRKQ
jgi:geranylgeranyl pyrophosphate synthase